MENFTGEDKLRLLLLAALSCGGSSTGSGAGGASGGGNGGGSSGGSSVTFSLSSSELDQYCEQLMAAHPDLDTSAVRYVHHLR